MDTKDGNGWRRLILDQFTRQAAPFSEMHARDDAEIHELLIGMAATTSADDVLDVARGPGLVACEVAKAAQHVTGIDLTPAMIAQCHERQQSPGLTNLTWVVGDALPLPFFDASFSRVIYPVEVEALLSRSFPNPGGTDGFRRAVEADTGVDRMGIGANRDGGLGFSFPVVIVSGVK